MKIDLNARSKYFTMREMIHSDTADKMGIDNTPDEVSAFNLRNLMSFLDLVRYLWGKPIKVNSGFRCKELNTAVGGKPKSQHQWGLAADITTGSKATNKELFDIIVQNAKMLNFDQCINESNYSWIHISKQWQAERNRNQILYL